MLRQEDFESVQLLGNTLDVVQAVNTNDDLDPLEPLLEGPQLLQYRFCFQTLRKCFQNLVTIHGPDPRCCTHPDELLWVNTNREGTNVGIATLVDETVWHRRDTKDTGA